MVENVCPKIYPKKNKIMMNIYRKLVYILWHRRSSTQNINCTTILTVYQTLMYKRDQNQLWSNLEIFHP